jgi:hypothetical protein
MIVKVHREYACLLIENPLALDPLSSVLLRSPLIVQWPDSVSSGNKEDATTFELQARKGLPESAGRSEQPPPSCYLRYSGFTESGNDATIRLPEHTREKTSLVCTI